LQVGVNWEKADVKTLIIREIDHAETGENAVRLADAALP